MSPPHAPHALEAGGRDERRARILCVAYGVVTFLFFGIWNHFLADRSADPAIFENLLWNATHGNGLATWLESEGGRLFPHLAVHFSPVIWLLVPLYQLFPSMHVVHLVVCACTAVAGWRVFRLAREGLDAGTSLLLMGAFLLHPTVILQTFMEFHEQALAPLPLLVLVSGYRRGALASSLMAALFLLSMREDNALLVLGIALLALVARRDVRLGLGLLALGAAWLWLYRWMVVEGLGGGVTPGVFSGTYGIWGDTPGAAVRTMLGDPVRVVKHLLSPTAFVYLGQLLAPFLGVLGFGSPLALAMLPQVFMILLSQHDGRMFEIRLHYSIAPVTLLTVGAIGALHRLRSATLTVAGRCWRWPRVLASAMLVVSAATVPVWMVRAIQRLNPEVKEMRAVMALVPDTSSVTAPGYLLNHMARRRRIGLSWVGPYTVNEYVILEDPERQVRGMSIEERRRRGSSIEVAFTPEVAGRLRAAGYREIFAQGGWHVWRRPPR